MIIFVMVVAFLAGFLLINIGPAYAFVTFLLFMAAYAFIFNFKKMFIFFIIVRPVLDIFKDFGMGIGYSNVNMAAAVSFLFIVGGFLHLNADKKGIIVCKEIMLYIFFLVFALLGTIFNLDVVGIEGLFSWSRLLVVLVVMLVIYNDYNDKKSLVQLMRCILYSAVIPVVYAIVQVFTRVNMSTGQGFERVTGGFAHSNVFAPYLTIFIIMIFCMIYFKNEIVTKRSKFYLSGYLTVLICCMFLTYARGAWISLVISFFLLGVLFFRRKFVYGVVLLGFVVFLGYAVFGKFFIVDEVMRRFEDVQTLPQTQVLNASDNSLSWRLLYWQELVAKLKESPVIGFGLGSVVILGSAHLEAHSNYVQIFFESGMGGFFYFLMLFVLFARSCKYLYSPNPTIKAFAVGVLGVLIAYFINSISGHLIRNAVYQIYFLALPMIMVSLANNLEQG